MDVTATPMVWKSKRKARRTVERDVGVETCHMHMHMPQLQEDGDEKSRRLRNPSFGTPWATVGVATPVGCPLAGFEMEYSERKPGGTERSWCKAISGGTGTACLGFLLSPSPSHSSLLSALHALQQHSSPLLRSTLSPNLSFSISALPTLQLHQAPADASSTLQSLLVRELNVKCWDLPNPDLLHATLYPLPDSPSAILVLRIHTAIADRTSTFTIARQLIGLLAGDLVSGGELKECLEDLIPAQHKKKAFWARGKDLVGYSLNFTRSSHFPFVDTRGQRSSDMLMLDLDSQETQKLLDGCKDRGIKLCGVLTAAALISAVLYKHHSNNKSETYTSLTLVDCRKFLSNSLRDNDIGFYHSAIQNLHTVKAGEGLWDVAVRCHDSFSSALRANKHFTDIDDLNMLMLKAIQAPQLTPSSSLRTALVSVFDEPGMYDTEDFYKGTCVKEYFVCSSAHGVGPSVALFDTIRDGQLSCACIYPSPLHSREQMLELVRSMKSLIIGAINP